MSGNTTVVSSTPGFVAGTYSAKQVRNTTIGVVPDGGGLLARGDFAVTQNGGGAMNVNIGAGRAFVIPTAVTYQGPYYCQNDSAYNTNTNGGYTWTAADGSNPRIDLLCIEVKDTAEDSSGTTGWRFRIVDGTANASATHQLLTTYWPAIPSGCLPIAAIRVPAAATTLTTTNITNLNPICGRNVNNYIATSESTTGTAMGRLVNSNGTADFATIYVPTASSVIEVAYKALISANVAAGNHDLAIFVNDVQLKAPLLRAAPAAVFRRFTFGTKFGGVSTDASVGAQTGGTAGLFIGTADSTTDETFETTPTIFAGASSTTAATAATAFIPIAFVAAGWNIVEVRYQASANTVTAKNRTTIARLAA